MTAQLRDAQAFTRGFLLAMDWANATPRPNLDQRVPRLAGEDIPVLYGTFRALPLASRQSLRITWAKREPLQRIDERVELHPSWMTERLRPEPPTTLLLALGELPPEMGRDVLRTLWPKVRPSRPEDSLGEITPLQPALAGHLRRRLFTRFVRLRVTETATGRFTRLLDLDAAELWLLSQELGRIERARTRSATDSDDTAAKHLQVVEDISKSEDQVVGLLGLRLLAVTLALAPREYCLHVAQKMAYPIAQHLLDWRDSDDSSGKSSERTLHVVCENVDIILQRRRAHAGTE